MGAGTGFGRGLGEGLSDIAATLKERKLRASQDREKRADLLEERARSIATNMKSLPDGEKNPEWGKYHEQLSGVLKQRNDLYQAHEAPALVQRIKKFLGGGQQQQQPNVVTPEQELAQAPRQVNPYMQKRSQAIEAGATPERADQMSGLKDEPATEDWKPYGEPYVVEGKTYQRQINKAGKFQTGEVPGPAIEPEVKIPKPPVLHSNAIGGGLETIDDPKTGKSYHSGNIETAPPEIKELWKSVTSQQNEERKRKMQEEDHRFMQGIEKTTIAFQNALKRTDYVAAQREITKADENYRSAIDLSRTMDQNLKNALNGDQQAMLSLVANHIGMTLGAQKGARINRAVWEEAVSSTPWFDKIAAKFDERGYLAGVTLAPEQMRQMVSLAHEKVEILKQHKEELEYDKADVLGVKKPTSPKDLKEKAKPKEQAKPDDSDPLGIL